MQVLVDYVLLIADMSYAEGKVIITGVLMLDMIQQ